LPFPLTSLLSYKVGPINLEEVHAKEEKKESDPRATRSFQHTS